MAAKPRPTSLTATIAVSIKPGTHHAHGCTVCSSRYSDACDIPAVNGRCPGCRQGSRPLWDRDMDPRPCCRTASRPATRDEVGRYSLGGPGPWFRCSICARTHPYDATGRGRTP